jgi:hypothetical protein
MTKNIYFLLLILIFGGCKKEHKIKSCTSIEHKISVLNEMKYLLQDTTEISWSERQFFNEIRTIANDVEVLSATVDTTVSIQHTYSQIKDNFLAHAALVTQKATTFYNGSTGKIILARNAFVLMSYDALERKYPEFMWTQLGIFAANEVRSGLVQALMLRQVLIDNNINIPFGATDLTTIMLQSAQILIDGQIDVLTDIGSFGILNKKVGAAKIKNETWMTNEAKEGFRLQEQAENALHVGNCALYQDIQTAAAIQFGAHEQVYILQPMWDKPLMKQFADIDKLMIQLTGHKFVFFGNIFVGTNKDRETGKGYTIVIPNNVNDLSNAAQRVKVAINGFNTLNNLRKGTVGSDWIDYSQVKIGYYKDIYNVVWIK